MPRSFGIIALSVFLFSSGAAHAYELIEVRSGNEIVVSHEGRRVTLVLAGVWVPDPPTAGYEGDYQGVEAREFVENLFYTEPIFIREVGPPERGERGETIRVRIRVGEDGDYDLAVSLAHEGLGLFMEAPGVEEEYLEAIYRAERGARRAIRGMHDGGYEDYRRSSDRSVVSFGVGVVGSQPGQRGYRAYGDSFGSDGGSASGGGSDKPPVRSVVRGIRDWGAQMGLPPDSSRPGL
jgi:hypothetical protein